MLHVLKKHATRFKKRCNTCFLKRFRLLKKRLHLLIKLAALARACNYYLDNESGKFFFEYKPKQVSITFISYPNIGREVFLLICVRVYQSLTINKKTALRPFVLSHLPPLFQ